MNDDQNMDDDIGDNGEPPPIIDPNHKPGTPDIPYSGGLFKCGICGEHGGEPSSVEFCHSAGLNYVSCSPFRVPIAKLSAAHAALSEQ